MKDKSKSKTGITNIWKNVPSEEKSLLRFGIWFIVIGGLICVVGLPYLLTREMFDSINYKDKGGIGDTINGIAGPFIAILASLLTFLAFYIQYVANREQRRMFMTNLRLQRKELDERDRTWKVERFENRFFEYLRFHRENVSAMNIGDKVYGNKCFVPMYYELRFCYLNIEDHINSTDHETKMAFNYNQIRKMDLAYSIFFFGIGPQSEKHYRHSLNTGEIDLLDRLKQFFERIQNSYEKHMEENPRDRYYSIPFGMQQMEFYYYPFDGHINRLSHYFRHLYQIVTFVGSQDCLRETQVVEYIRTVRSLMTNFEQLLLYYNAISWFPSEWHTYFVNLRLIKNLPLPLADFYIEPESYFKVDILRLQREGKDPMFAAHE